ncbi:MAG: DNA methyltransferase [Pirellulaceae bacterium]
MTWCTPEHLWSVRNVHGTSVDEPFIVFTSNLVADDMLVPCALGSDSTEWRSVNVVDQQYYSGLVYSVEVEHDHHYIADGIVTHNCFYGWKEDAGHKYFGPNNVTDLWQVKKIPPQRLEHLTGKPAELAVRAMQYSSVAGENVLDLFGGSDSTLIGPERCGRNAFLMEIDAPYADVIVDRFQRYSGVAAVLERTGESPIPMKPREENMR